MNEPKLDGLDGAEGSPDSLSPEALMSLLRPMSVFKRIYTLRELFNISQTTLANICGITRQSVVSWEMKPGTSNKAHGPGPHHRHLLAKTFGVPAFVFTPDFNMENFKETSDAFLRKKRSKVPRRKRGGRATSGGRPFTHNRDDNPEPEPQEVEAPEKPQKPAPAPGVIRIG